MVILQEECNHSYDKKCHTSFSTEYEAQQEEECDDNYKKECDITYSPHAENVTVRVCMTPLVKVKTYPYIRVSIHPFLPRTATLPGQRCVVPSILVSAGLRMILILLKMMFPAVGRSIRRSA